MIGQYPRPDCTVFGASSLVTLGLIGAALYQGGHLVSRRLSSRELQARFAGCCGGQLPDQTARNGLQTHEAAGRPATTAFHRQARDEVWRRSGEYYVDCCIDRATALGEDISNVSE